MSTRSSTRNLFPPLDNPELTIQRRSRADPTLLNNFEMAAEGNSDLPVPDLQTMKELCQPSLNGRGGPISPIAIQATDFGLKNDMIQQSIKVNGVTDDALRLYLFPHSLTHHATNWFDRLPRNSINTFEQMAKIFLGKYFPPSMVTMLKNEITNFRQRPDESLFEAWERYKLSIDRFPNHNMLPPPLAKPRTYMLHEPIKGVGHGQNPPPAYQALGYQAPVHQPQIPQPHVVTTNEFTNFMNANDDILKNMQTNMTSLTTSNLELKNTFGQFMKMNTASSSGSGTLPGNTITNTKEDLKGITTRSGTAYQRPTIPTTSSSLPPVVERETEVTKDTMPPANNGSTKDVQPPPNQKPSIPYPSRLHDQKLRDKTNDQKEKIFQIFKDLNFNISFVDAFILMPKFGPTIKTLLTNKDKLSELARTLLNEHCSAVLLKKLPEKLGDPGKVAEDVFVKVGMFHFPADFVVVDFDADPRVPLILERSFLKTGRALIDIFEGELTLRIGKEAITFNLDQTSRYSANYNDMTAKRIDVIDMACEEYSEIDFLLKEVDAFLALEDDPTSPKVDQSYFDPEEYILLLEAFLNDDPSLPPPNQGNYLPQDLPPHLECVFLEGDDKLPIIIEKDLSDEEKTALITVLKSHKRAITWRLSDIKGINPEFYTHKILMKDDFEPAVQHQRRVNPKIHDVIKKEVLKLLDAGLIYPISDSPLVSPVYYVTKKGSFTVVENEENELIPTRLDTGWRVCIDYRKMNEATRKDHFLLPFMDQIPERLAGNEYYCFLDGFSGNFQIPIDPKDQEKTKFTCPYRTFAYHRKPFGLCNAPCTFQRCMLAIFHDMIEKTMEVFMDDFSVFGNSFQTCLSHLEKMLKRCEDTNLCLNWEKSHFMVKEGIVLGYKISKNEIEVDKAKVEVIAKLTHPTTVKGIRSFLGHAGFYRRFIQDFSKIARPMTRLLEKDTLFFFSKECVEAFQTLKRKLTEASILIAPDWDLPFELMCDASDFAIGVYMARKPLTFSRLATMDPPRDIMARTTLPRRFGTPCAIISDRRTYFCNDQLTKVMLKYGVTHRLATPYHPQTNGQVEEKTKRLHDLKIKDCVFNISDRVLLFNPRLKIFSGNLKTRWSGPFTITHVFPYGTVELSQLDGPNFKVNGHRLKHYFGEGMPKMVVHDLKPFPRTNECGDWVKLSDPKQALRGRHPMLILIVVMNKMCCYVETRFSFSCVLWF
nr:reverse transcriptase domain-containing protein [Tanacetum cinerariifolium]